MEVSLELLRIPNKIQLKGKHAAVTITAMSKKRQFSSGNERQTLIAIVLH